MIIRPFIVGSVVTILVAAPPLTTFAADGGTAAVAARPAGIRSSIAKVVAEHQLDTSSGQAPQGGVNQMPTASPEHRFGKGWLFWTLIGAGAGFATGYLVKEAGGQNERGGRDRGNEDQSGGQ